jgi:hypothetical protein
MHYEVGLKLHFGKALLYFFLSFNFLYVFAFCNKTPSGPGSVVGIGTSYGLYGPGIESRWGRDFSHLSRPALGPTQRPVQ